MLKSWFWVLSVNVKFLRAGRPIMNIDTFVNVSFLLCVSSIIFLFLLLLCSVLFYCIFKTCFQVYRNAYIFSYIDSSCSSNHDTVNLYIFSSLQIAVVAVMCKPHRCPHISMTGNICVYCPGGPDSDFEYSTQSYTGYEVITHIMRKYCFIKEIAGLDLELWGSQPLWFLAPLKKKRGCMKRALMNKKGILCQGAWNNWEKTDLTSIRSKKI